VNNHTGALDFKFTPKNWPLRPY